MQNKPIKRHNNAGYPCPKCEQILKKYPGIDATLYNWFKFNAERVPFIHVSEAGRGRAKQEAFKKEGSSRASYGQSAHNYNMALDIFFQVNGKLSYDRSLYAKISIFPEIVWYGAPGSKFPELPHFEIKGWREKADKKLVE